MKFSKKIVLGITTLSIFFASSFCLNQHAIVSAKDQSASEQQNSSDVATEYFNLGLQKYREKKYSEAIESFSHAIKLNPKYALAYNNRGATYYYQGKLDQAIEDFKKALELDPNNQKARNNLNKLQK